MGADKSGRLVEALNGAAAHGLDPRAFLGPVEAAAEPAAREAALSLAALTFASALARGKVDPGRIHEVYEVPRPEADVAAGLNQAIEGGNVGEWLGGLAPQDAEYRMLSEAYVAATARPAATRPPIPGLGDPPGRPIHSLPIAAALLAGLLPLQRAGRATANRYTLTAAAVRPQEDHA